MMGVVRYKSTGNMLNSSEHFGGGKQNKKLDSGDEEEPEEEDLELARAKPLLWSTNGASGGRKGAGAKWGSCKLLGREPEAVDRYQQEQEGQEHIELKKWIPHHSQSKSIADFLALSIQQQCQYDEPNDQQQQTDGFAGGWIGCRAKVNNSKHCQPLGGEQQQVSYDVWQQPSETNSSGATAAAKRSARRVVLGTKRANGARRRRVSKMKLASLSLSSPALSQDQQQVSQQTMMGRMEHDDEPENDASQDRILIRQQQHYQQQQQAIVPVEHGIGAEQDNGSQSLLQQPVAADARACETKVRANSSNSGSQCLVDVDKLIRQQQHQLTNERSSSCYTTTTNAGSMDASYTNAVYSPQIRQDIVSQLVDGANDNGGFGQLLSRDVGAGDGQFYDGQCSAAANAANLACPTITPPSSQQQHNSSAHRFHYAPAQQVSAIVAANKRQVLDNNDNYNQLVELSVRSEYGKANRRIETTNSSNTDSLKETNLATTNNKLMVDLNGAANRLMGSCCNSWRQALHHHQSGSYKVAHEQPEVASSISGNTTTTTGSNQHQVEQQETGGVDTRNQESRQQVTTNNNNNVADNTHSGGPGNKERRIARYSRPGRSPISLQRQTNARLTRHKLKIQQQRQEQLAQLALRERQQFLQLNQNNNNYNHRQVQTISSRHTNCEKSTTTAPQPEEVNNPILRGHESLYLINDLLGRLSLNKTTTGNARTNQQLSISRGSGPVGGGATAAGSGGQQDYRLALDELENQRQQQHQVIIPTVTREAIEICDNQLACSSRQVQHPLAPTGGYLRRHNSHQAASTNNYPQRPPGNVIVYNSINMLRNGSSDASYGQHHNASRSSINNKQRDHLDIENDDTQTISSSGSSTLSLNKPFCKICHIGSSKNGDKLISPCRCSGTMQYIHCGCLLKWLEISNRTNEKPMSCELCAHEYTWHKKFNYKQMRLPKCCIKDIFLHIIFVVAIGVMLYSALAPMLYRKSQDITTTNTNQQQTTSGYRTAPDNQHRQMHHPGPPFHHTTTFSGQSNGHHIATGSRLANDEKFILFCAASFFISFFLSIYVQTKARDTLYGLIVKFLAMNQTFYITEFDHGQLNDNNISKHQQQQQQQQQYGADSRFDRKGSQKS